MPRVGDPERQVVLLCRHEEPQIDAAHLSQDVGSEPDAASDEHVRQGAALDPTVRQPRDEPRGCETGRPLEPIDHYYTQNIVGEYQHQRDFEGFKMELLRTLAVESPYDEKEFLAANSDEMVEKLFQIVYKNYQDKSDIIAKKTYPVIKDVFERNSPYENIAIPITDGKKTMQAVANLKKAYEDNAKEVNLSIEKGISLGTIDNAWKDHLREMDELKQSVQNASYEQKDPLLIYKFESFELFKKMIQKINKDVGSYLIKADVFMQNNAALKEVKMPRGLDRSQMKEQRGDLLSQAHSDTQDKSKPQPVKVEKRVGRNDPCPCGSGKKYKQCHGKNLA